MRRERSGGSERSGRDVRSDAERRAATAAAEKTIGIEVRRRGEARTAVMRGAARGASIFDRAGVTERIGVPPVPPRSNAGDARLVG